MNFYIQYVYLTGPELGRCDYIGPFDGTQAASEHMQTYGPVRGNIVKHMRSNPVDLISPEEHIEHMKSRTDGS